ncbi:hypothetical protein [Paenibacillus sp. UNC496MF]|uniref:hypothetical protein n=1 Tax=Paenibacillus sp. UNC496MF TaxID=1502753 RepID=UPI001160B42B|nr:hypothetical protein [Paenibacillus sp. UNC496MF]
MPNTYNKMIVQGFYDKIESLKKQEERGLRIENQFGSEHQSSLIRQVSIEVYGDILELINEHFKLSGEAAPKRRGGRKPGSRNKAKEVTASEEILETAAATEE